MQRRQQLQIHFMTPQYPTLLLRPLHSWRQPPSPNCPLQRCSILSPSRHRAKSMSPLTLPPQLPQTS
jgi:hypothetical protein